ncbi:N-acetylmuramoyl-L-alanine amidase [Jannaschia pagri]|uniref:N-acetylmuramoyl-L-alanine amidase n=1 Tax=Jannaschia pagri TaxID=2829797 RepID=A0ABQ4NJJ7_9RHOB|nr:MULTISPECIES: N-acetylmuramoyl-L-alanine amidase [unclassified Jannaschia]GIT90756.1 N-acetylmuramoyl-L-alanine amidase [Jannaschia sp. AI_61]GIT94588.1 N-acetylmuramoyl-L-alanine amidase [Jannaschia sp. AI_62]
MIVLHYTAMEGGAGPAIQTLCSPEAQVSCHYVIDEGGELTQLVQDSDRAWHAGRGRWGESDDVNSRSIGIELSNTGVAPFPEPQMDALEDLLRDLMARHGIDPKGVIGHSDCAPGRKIDPGTRFDWRRLALRGLSIWPPSTLPEGSAGTFAAHLRSAGWTAEVDDQTLLSAFRLRFRPWATGPCDAQDAGIARWLAETYPTR